MFRDLRYAIRNLRTAPAFAFTVILTLGVGLGLNTALFTLFNNFVLRPFAVRDPYTLYSLGWTTPAGVRSNVTWDQYKRLSAEASVFSETMAVFPVLSRVETRNLQGMAVSGNYFTALGVGAALGRPILPADANLPGAGSVVVLSHQVWQDTFAGDPSIAGRSIQIAGVPFQVIGVAPADFIGVSSTQIDFYIPITMKSAVTGSPDLFTSTVPSLVVLGRLKPEISVQRAQAALTIWIRDATELQPESERAIQASLTSQATPVPLTPQVIALFLPVFVIFALVLVICCANVSNMMLARALGRQREIGVRLALGAERSRLIRQLLSENLLLSLSAGALGFAISAWSIRAGQANLLASLPPALTTLVRIPPLDPNYRVFVFALIVASFSTLLFGLAPALQATRMSLVQAIRGEFGARASSSRLRSLLVVSQISVCLVLLVLTGVLLRKSAAYRHSDPGFSFHHVEYPVFIGRSDGASSSKLGQRLRTEPWIEELAAAWHPPMSPVSQIPVTAESSLSSVRVGYNLVSPEYFKLLDIPAIRGRLFSAAETSADSAVAVVSQATARALWPSEDALGKMIVLDKRSSAVSDVPRPDKVMVIGIVKDVTSGPLIAGQDATMVYFPTSISANRVNTFLIRGRGNTLATSQSLEKVLASTAPNRPVITTSLDETFSTQNYPFRAGATIAALLGGLALALTLSGMYGVLSYVVGQRTKQIGIRIALGATAASVVRLVFRQSLKLAIWGTSVGLMLAVGGAVLLRHVVTKINAYDGIAFTAGTGIVILAALVATVIPSNKAARVNPVEALRSE